MQLSDIINQINKDTKNAIYKYNIHPNNNNNSNKITSNGIKKDPHAQSVNEQKDNFPTHSIKNKKNNINNNDNNNNNININNTINNNNSNIDNKVSPKIFIKNKRHPEQIYSPNNIGTTTTNNNNNNTINNIDNRFNNIPHKSKSDNILTYTTIDLYNNTNESLIDTKTETHAIYNYECSIPLEIPTSGCCCSSKTAEHYIFLVFLKDFKRDNDKKITLSSNNTDSYVGRFLNGATKIVTKSPFIHVQIAFGQVGAIDVTDNEYYFVTFSVDQNQNKIYHTKNKLFTKEGWVFKKIPITIEQEIKCINYLNKHLGEEFSKFRMVFGSKFDCITKCFTKKKTWFCSELVACALIKSGILDDNIKNATKYTPSSLFELFQQFENLNSNIVQTNHNIIQYYKNL